nr:hypothetical protein CFP56_10411 [Quercus suber]
MVGVVVGDSAKRLMAARRAKKLRAKRSRRHSSSSTVTCNDTTQGCLSEPGKGLIRPWSATTLAKTSYGEAPDRPVEFYDYCEWNPPVIQPP